ncbi:MAG: gluconolaconase [Acidobacteria bacterium]|nr:gluconolaconase [Acidobacteriota bacterium]
MTRVGAGLLEAIQPVWAVEGGRVTIRGADFPLHEGRLPEVRIGDEPARIVYASRLSLGIQVPSGLGGRLPVRVEGLAGETALLDVGLQIATGLHQVDSPVFDRAGNLYLTFSGSRGEQVPTSIFKVGPGAAREAFVSGVVNPTSLAVSPDGYLYVSSRFEGTIYRVRSDGTIEPIATELGVPCGLAFDSAGTLYVGDRSGTIFRVTRTGHTDTFASLPPSVAAFHLAMGPGGYLHVAAPTLAPRDHIYRISPDGDVEITYSGFGRPQGLAFDAQGSLYVVDALAGNSGLYKLRPDAHGSVADLVLAASSLIGLAFDPHGGLVVTSADTAYRLGVNVRPAPFFP